MKRMLAGLTAAAIVFAFAATMVDAAPAAKTAGKVIGINVVLKGHITEDRVKALEVFGKVVDRIEAIDALTMRAREADLDVIRALPFVAAANPDAERQAGPAAWYTADDLDGGQNTWDLDAINVTDFGVAARQVPFDGTGVYVAVLDTGLLHTWRAYFPAERIATEYGRAFGGGGGEVGFVSSQPNKWERDQDSHGTHVTSTVLGFALGSRHLNGVAPKATVIPVKVLGQAGWGWSSVIARGIIYVADLKAGPLADSPVIINMSLGGPSLDAVEQAAIDYAIDMGVIIVASAGNRGAAGMGYPGAYAPVISSAASGFTGEWPAGVVSWWRNVDVAEEDVTLHSYITDFSSRAKPGQDLDVAAPGSWIVGPYQVNGQLSWYYLGGTSMASPHVAGIVALMAQKYPTLTAAEAEAILELAAAPLNPGCVTVNQPAGPEEFCWEADATGAGLITADAALAATP